MVRELKVGETLNPNQKLPISALVFLNSIYDKKVLKPFP